MSERIFTADGEWVADATRVVRGESEWDGRNLLKAHGDRAAEESVLLPLALYLAHPQPAHAGVWLAPTDDPAELRPHLDRLSIIAIDFPRFTDGRGYSSAALLRRDGFRGELRAIGEVLVDQLYFLKRVGFTSFALRTDQDLALARRALHAFSVSYQSAADTLPVSRRRARPHAADNRFRRTA